MDADLQQQIIEAISMAKGIEKGREISLVITKLEEALLWLSRVGCQ